MDVMENVVKYRIFVKDGDSFATESKLETLLAHYQVFLSPFIDDFIWQVEPFCLVTKAGKGDNPAHLHGKTKFGDNVDDEWFIVCLLFKLSKAFPETCVSISDNDGEFLLIEAADFLPRWLTPDNSKNRVFVHDGKVHIIPLPATPGELTIYPTGTPILHQALKLVFGPHNTEAVAKIQETIRQRIAIISQSSSHHAHCYVPAEIKFVLDQKPSLISPVVQAFYGRDPVDMKACRTMDQFTLKTRLLSRIRFTRCLYAQLSQQPFSPDKRSEWTLPPVTDPHYKAHELGLKLACGFQILCRRSGASQPDSKVIDEPNGPKWERFCACLSDQGYFKGEIEGSKLYQDLLKKAKKQFSENFSTQNRTDPGQIILTMLKDAVIDVEKMKAEELLPEDDDSWLNLTDQDLENMLSKYRDLNSRKTGRDTHTNTPNHNESSVDLDSVTRTFKAFVDKVSSYEGAEFPGDPEDVDIQFDADSFMDTVGNLLGQGVRHRDEESDSDADDEDMDFSSGDESETNQGVEASTYLSEDDKEMKTVMEEMDNELAQTSIGESFEKSGKLPKETRQTQTNHSGEPQCDSDDDAPVDVDFNLVKNILESFSTQQGLAGPASNILNSMGVWLPPNNDQSDPT